MKYVIDTNIINWLVDCRISPDELPSDGELIATYLQVEELNRTKDEKRRGQLFLRFAVHAPKIVVTETADWGVAPLGMFKLGTGPHFELLKRELDRRNGGRTSNKNDAMIAEVALVNSYVLLTADKDLAEVANQYGGMVKNFNA